MQDISNNGIITLTRGDTFTAPLFLNVGQEIKPIRYKLKDGVSILKDTYLEINSILTKGTIITRGSNINGQIALEDQTIPTDFKIYSKSFLNKYSVIHNNSYITSNSMLNGVEQTQDNYIIGDRVYFALMEPNQPFEQAVVKKVYTSENLNENGDVVIELNPEDTVCLVPNNDYYYQIKSKFIDEQGRVNVNTVTPKTIFIIEE